MVAGIVFRNVADGTRFGRAVVYLRNASRIDIFTRSTGVLNIAFAHIELRHASFSVLVKLRTFRFDTRTFSNNWLYWRLLRTPL